MRDAGLPGAPVAIVEPDVVHELHAGRDAGHRPDQQQDRRRVGFVEPAALVLERAKAQIVLNRHHLWSFGVVGK